jgi:hypothetical protein
MTTSVRKPPSTRANDALKLLQSEKEAKSILVKWIEEPAKFSVLPFEAISSLNPHDLECGTVYLIQTTKGAYNAKLIQIGTNEKCEGLLAEFSGSSSGFASAKRSTTQSIEPPSQTRKTSTQQQKSTPKAPAQSTVANSTITNSSTTEADVDQDQQYDTKLLLAKIAERDSMLKEANTSLKIFKEENTVLKERLANASNGLSK